MKARGRGFGELQEAEMATQVELSRLYGQWLVKEATRYSLPLLAARPTGSLFERAMAQIG